MDDKYKELREKAYIANMELPRLNLVLFTFGNVSVVDRSLEVFAIKPSGVPYQDLTPEKIVIAPQMWFVNQEMNAQTRDLIPQNWLRI
jgi:L-ribulose-5-phosphate 4-epimerase